MAVYRARHARPPKKTSSFVSPFPSPHTPTNSTTTHIPSYVFHFHTLASFCLKAIYKQGRNHTFKVRGQIPRSRVLPFYRKKQVYPVWCSRLHNLTLFVKKLRKTWVFFQISGEVRSSPTPSGCAHVYKRTLVACIIVVRLNVDVEMWNIFCHNP